MTSEERSSDTSQTYGNQPLPGGSSDQNTEEDPTPGGGEGGRRDDQDPGAETPGREDSQGNKDSEGGAGEGSQATGNPAGAG